MKHIIPFLMALAVLLTLSACADSQAVSTTEESSTLPAETQIPQKALTALEIRDALKEKLGDSYGCSVADDEAKTAGYFGLDMEQIESWVAESHAVSSVNMDQAVILQVKEGYAPAAAECLQQGFNQKAGYARMYSMDQFRIAESRLFVQGNYVALLVLGKPGDPEADAESQAAFAAEEGLKVDAAWEEIFGSVPENILVIPTDEETPEHGGFGGARPRA